MARKTKGKSLPSWTYYKDRGSAFAMITNDLIFSDAFQNLPPDVQLLYIKLCVWKQNKDQHRALYKAMQSYHLYETDNETQMAADDFNSPLFVFSTGQIKKLASLRSVRRQLPILIENGFIRVVREKGQAPTIYSFSNDWKTYRDGER